MIPLQTTKLILISAIAFWTLGLFAIAEQLVFISQF